jgi:hypothetical protein
MPVPPFPWVEDSPLERSGAAWHARPHVLPVPRYGSNLAHGRGVLTPGSCVLESLPRVPASRPQELTSSDHVPEVAGLAPRHTCRGPTSGGRGLGSQVESMDHERARLDSGAARLESEQASFEVEQASFDDVQRNTGNGQNTAHHRLDRADVGLEIMHTVPVSFQARASWVQVCADKCRNAPANCANDSDMFKVCPDTSEYEPDCCADESLHCAMMGAVDSGAGVQWSAAKPKATRRAAGTCPSLRTSTAQHPARVVSLCYLLRPSATVRTT